jgi:hypothetical protein
LCLCHPHLQSPPPPPPPPLLRSCTTAFSARHHPPHTARVRLCITVTCTSPPPPPPPHTLLEHYCIILTTAPQLSGLAHNYDLLHTHECAPPAQLRHRMNALIRAGLLRTLLEASREQQRFYPTFSTLTTSVSGCSTARAKRFCTCARAWLPLSSTLKIPLLFVIFCSLPCCRVSEKCVCTCVRAWLSFSPTLVHAVQSKQCSYTPVSLRVHICSGCKQRHGCEHCTSLSQPTRCALSDVCMNE